MFKYFIVLSLCVVLCVGQGKNIISCTRPHEHYECGSACQTECQTLGQQCPIVNVRCNDACYCDEGYARNDKSTCIPINECPHERKKNYV